MSTIPMVDDRDDEECPRCGTETEGDRILCRDCATSIGRR